MKATYTKLKSGDWGVRIEGAVKPGAIVTVTKKSGETKSETISKVLWMGNGISLCAIGASGNGSSHGNGGARKCADCGGPVTGTYRYCRDCSYEHRDGGSQHAGGMSYYDSHGNFVLGDDD
jgi:hypothetical protein